MEGNRGGGEGRGQIGKEWARNGGATMSSVYSVKIIKRLIKFGRLKFYLKLPTSTRAYVISHQLNFVFIIRRLANESFKIGIHRSFAIEKKWRGGAGKRPGEGAKGGKRLSG